MTTPFVRQAQDRGIGVLTLDSPHNRNALSARLIAELREGLAAAVRDPGVRAVLLTHTGNTFSSGADLTEVTGQGSAPDPAGATKELAGLLRAVLACPKPVVALVTGQARAGGLGLLGACDIVVAGADAGFAFTEVRIGVAPAMISMPLLPRVQPRAAARYYLTGERFDAAEAARIGLVTVTAEDPRVPLTAVLDGLRRGSPQGLAEAQALVTSEVLAVFDRDTEELASRSAWLFGSAEAQEGIAALFERRDAWWVR